MGNGGKRGLAAVGLVILLTILFCLSARAEEGSVWTEEGSVSGDLGEYDFSQVEEWVREEMDGGEEFSFTELLGLLMSGQLGEAAGLLARTAGASLTDGLAAGAGFLGQVVVLGLSGAVFAGFAGVFRTGQISETGFFITYLLLCALLAAGFGEADFARIHNPIGLPILAETPAEIAVSVAAEMILARARRRKDA